jgi:TonB-dependent receptor
MFCSISFAGLEGNGKIEGTVLDSQNNEPLPGANVVIEGTRYGAATDLKGKFVISQIPPGNYKLVVSYIGYRKKIVDVTVEDGQTVTQAIKLDFQIIEGQVVEVTAQAEGQLGAINQQLSSNTISNIVSQARIRELPDVNAAESIGRLPGISIDRSGGEATRVSIRGLSPKYNTVTVNGVRVPATGGDDRSVDLSLISSQMLDGIEVKKAITPDMDADAIGGTVDLRLKEAPDQLSFNVTAQGGYNRLQDYLGNYNVTGSVSNRFFDGRLGVIASFNTDDYDRSADKYSGDFRPYLTVDGRTENAITNINLREENVTRGRTGASALIDYRLPNGKITANSFYNRLKWDGLFRINDLNVNTNRHSLDFEERGGTTSIFTGGVGIEQDFDWLRYDFGLARTASRSKNPNEMSWHFTREGGSFRSVPPDALPTDIPSYATNDSNRIGIQDIYIYNTNREENQTTLQLNVKKPFRLSSQITGYVKMGGKARWLDRENNEDQFGRNGIYYGNNQGPNSILTVLDESLPEWKVDSLVRTYGVLGISRFQTNYSRSNFLNGDYPLGFVADFPMLKTMTQALIDGGQFLPYSIGSLGNDYDGKERYYAGYAMAELNLGKLITFLPGVRYEKDFSKYHGWRFRETTRNNIQSAPDDLSRLEVERDNDFWLPMVHVQVQPRDWLKIRLAGTKTLTRPDYNQYAPIARIDVFQAYVRATNSKLKPAQSNNLDAAVSVYQNHIGLFTVAGFYKEIKDLIFQVNHPIHPDIINSRPDVDSLLHNNLNLLPSWTTRVVQYGVDTFINNPFKAKLRGFELDWQTNFWYLPSVLRGIVLNVNYTQIHSEMEKRLYFRKNGARIPRPGPPSYYQVLVDSSRTSRLPDQPTHIANVTLGYDYKGFSGRLSYLYQTDRVAFIAAQPAGDNFSGAYERWDLTLQQKIGRTGVQLFANLTNLNNRPDRNFRGSTSVNPTYIEYYGFAIDGGVRYKF